MTEIIGEPVAVCPLCGGKAPRRFMVEVRSGRAYHPSCVTEYMAETVDKMMTRRQEIPRAEKEGEA